MASAGGRQVSQQRASVHDVAAQAQFLTTDPHGQADGLGHVKDWQPYISSRLRGSLGLEAVQVQVAEWTWGNHGVGTQIPWLHWCAC